jgi:hypothetical protein
MSEQLNSEYHKPFIECSDRTKLQAICMANFVGIILTQDQIRRYVTDRNDQDFYGLSDQVILYSHLELDQQYAFEMKYLNINFCKL